MDLTLPSRLVDLKVFVGQHWSTFRSSRKVSLAAISEGSAPSYTNLQDSCCIQSANWVRAVLGSGRTVRMVATLFTGMLVLVLGVTKTMLWSEGHAVFGLSGNSAGQIVGSL